MLCNTQQVSCIQHLRTTLYRPIYFLCPYYLLPARHALSADMAASPPRGFITVRNALTGTWTKCSIIAVVVDSMPPMLSRGTSYVSTFTINDALDGERDGLKVRIFRSNPHKLPAPSRGDVVSICQLSVRQFKLYTKRLTETHSYSLKTFAVSWVVPPRAKICSGQCSAKMLPVV